MEYDVIIVGGGASGMFAGCFLNKEGKKLILEQKSNAGRKLLLAGSGQCNITHGGEIKDFITHYGKNGNRIRKILYKHNNQMMIDFFRSKGIRLIERMDGKVFPESLKGEDILAVLKDGCRETATEIVTGECVIQIIFDQRRKAFHITTNEQEYMTKNLILAGGGKSYRGTGSDGSLFPMVSALGIEVTSLKPALVPLVPNSYAYGSIAGISFENCQISLQRDGKLVEKINGDLIFAHKMLSGPGILNFSRYVNPGDRLIVNYLGSISLDEAIQTLEFQCKDRPQIQLSTILKEQFSLPKRFVDEILLQIELDGSTKLKTIAKRDMRRVAMKIVQDEFLITGTTGFGQAMATCGGICLDEINLKTMESKKIKNLYFVGEMLDIDGDTGGYNLQFAFSSGKLAAESINILDISSK